MDKPQAQKLVRETFENSFDKNQFINFIRNLLNSFEDAPLSYKGNIIYDAFDQYISTMERIGKYSDGDHKIDVLIVKLKKETSIERARTMQRNFVARYLNGSRGGELKDAALVAFVSPNEEDWRFSLVKMDYRFDESGKVKEEFTPAKRWSFLVGKNEASHTAQSRLVPIIADDDHNPTLAELEEAFNIEKATKEFFEKYKNLFLWTKETFDDIVANNEKIRTDFENKKVSTVDFTKKLLGQIVFLCFLQKKGWFGVGRDKAWGAGSKHFQRDLFEKKHSSYKNFFNDILEPLFYEALRIDRRHDDDYYSRFNCKIPFLNGGLFDPISNYDWVHTDILLPNELFSNSNKTKEGDIGDGILDIFDRYNFTVKEDEPLEKEVAVDPEMLGKVFENLLEVKDRKSKGSFYTPREIVHYMCQQSLINYLATELDSCNSRESGNPIVSKNDIETLIKYGEQLGENEAIVESKGKETDTYYYKLPESIRKNARLIDEKLVSIKVCDPAVGSGAFPVGMMHEIVKIRNVLSTYIINSGLQPIETRTTYNFKRECIEKSLYGVDIDPGAVEIAKLRLWLSLVVDEDDIHQIQPLPNLDYKIVCGNSLLGVERGTLFVEKQIEEMEKKKKLFFHETNPTKKQEYKNQIDELISQITNGHTEFDFEIYFSEVFHETKIEKDWKVFHITWVTHNSRRNENIAESKTEGTNPILLSLEDRNRIAEILSKRIIEKEYRVLALNVLDDHVHMLLVCEEDDVSSTVGNLKGYSSYTFHTGDGTGSSNHTTTRNHTDSNHTVNRMVADAEPGDDRMVADADAYTGSDADTFRSAESTPTYSDGTIRKLWAAKFSNTYMKSEEHFASTIEYIQNNHLKHTVNRMALPPIDFTIVQPAMTPLDKAFGPIIKPGGFDVVIANPPYLRERDNKKIFEIVNKSDFGKKYHQGKMDYWYYFLHKAIEILKNEGIISYITSRYWLNSLGAKKLIRRVNEELSFIDFVDIGKLKVFDEVAGQHMVAVYKKSKTKLQFNYKKLINDLSDISKNEETENLNIEVLSNENIFSENGEIVLENSEYKITDFAPLGQITDTSIGVIAHKKCQ